MKVEVLSDEDVAFLTGRRQKSQQIAQLRAMNLPFASGANGCPRVPVSAIEGTKKQARADIDEMARALPGCRVFYAAPGPRRPPGN